MGSAAAEVWVDVLMPVEVPFAGDVVRTLPCSKVKEVDELDSVTDGAIVDVAEPLATAIVDAQSAVSPLRLPVERVTVDVRL